MTKLNEFYENTNVLITGATGFIGKVLLEKLLRSQNNINRIYLLIRTKKNVSSEVRLKKIFESPIFENLKKICPNFVNKVEAITGDITQPKLGLKQNDIDIITNEVNIVFQSAASVNMGAPLKYNCEENFYSVLELLDICRQIKHLKSLVIVSTAYSSCNREVIEEKVYKSSISPEVAFKMIREMDDDILVNITESLQNGLPNSYTLSKSIMENALLNYQDLPIVVFRPGIVTGSVYEPLPGWVDSYNGPTGLFAIAGLGLFRVIGDKLDTKTTFVPVDFCVNALICSAWHGIESRLSNDNQMMVYNYTLNEYQETWNTYANKFRESKVKANKALWYPYLICIDSPFLNAILSFLLDVLPAIFLDCLIALTGNKFRLMRLFNEKVFPGMRVLKYFYSHEWIFKEGNVNNMLNSLNEEEKSVYAFDMGKVTFDELTHNIVVGVKVFILKEKMEDNDAAIRKHRILKVIHYITVCAFVSFISWMLYKFVKFVKF